MVIRAGDRQGRAVCSFCLNMDKGDHKEGGITFEGTKATGFSQVTEEGENSPPI